MVIKKYDDTSEIQERCFAWVTVMCNMVLPGNKSCLCSVSLTKVHVMGWEEVERWTLAGGSKLGTTR